MENPSGLFSRVSPEIAPYSSALARRVDSSDWLSVHEDLNLARGNRANLLIVGTELLVSSLVSSLVADANSHIMIRCQDGLRLPPTSSQSGTVLLRDVDALKKEEQLRLLDWMDSASTRIQVVSTAAAPLLRLKAGAFDAGLYYRLNTVYIDLTVERSRRSIY